jgi:hypothetical protein
MTDDGKRETSRRGFLGGAVSSAFGLFVGKARGAVSDGLPKIEMGDAGSDPSSNGAIARNGNRLKAYSAGQLIDFADALYPGQDFDGQGTSSFNNLQSVSTDEQSVGGHPSISEFETGVVSGNGPTAASSDGWDDNTISTLSVSFDTAFDSAPELLLEAQNTARLKVYPRNETTTGFDAQLFNYSTTDYSSTSIDIFWVAIN